MGFLSGLLSPVLSAVGSSMGGDFGGALGGILGTALGSRGSASSAAVADPFASQRGQYQQQLQDLMKGNFTPTDPSYQFRMTQGLDAVNRGAASSGLLRSGNRLAELMSYGQNLASTEYGNQFNRLALLSGAQIGSPATAAGIMQQNAAGSSALGGKFGNMLSGPLQNMLGNWMGGGSLGGFSLGSMSSLFGGSTDMIGVGAGGMDALMSSEGEGALASLWGGVSSLFSSGVGEAAVAAMA